MDSDPKLLFALLVTIWIIFRISPRPKTSPRKQHENEEAALRKEEKDAKILMRRRGEDPDAPKQPKDATGPQKRNTNSFVDEDEDLDV